MVVPEVNKEMLTDLEGMGFSTARATRALHFSGMFISDVVGFSCCNVSSALTEIRKSYTCDFVALVRKFSSLYIRSLDKCTIHDALFFFTGF